MNEQEMFWTNSFGDRYRQNNEKFDDDLQVKAWGKMLNSIMHDKPNTILECGSNIGRNLMTLKRLLPSVKVSLIEINKESFNLAVKNVSPEHSFNGTILQSDFKNNSFDLTYTSGVLIHIPPYDLYKNMAKIYNYSDKYILIAEYFARDMESKIYHGQINKLFKMDFGGFFMDNFSVNIVDYGFLWGREYDAGGFDDITWWLFKKKN